MELRASRAVIGPLYYACPKCRTVVTDHPGRRRYGRDRWTDGKPHSALVQQSITRCGNCSSFFWLDVSKTCEPGLRPERAYELTAADYCAALEAGIHRDKQEEIQLRMLAWWTANDPVREFRTHSIPWGCLPMSLALIATALFFSPGLLISGLLYLIGALGLFAVLAGIRDEIRRRKNAEETQRKQDEAFERNLNDPSFERNLRALILLLDEANPENCLRIAEAYRQLGDFNRALAVLSHFHGDDKEDAIIIARYARKEDRRVRLAAEVVVRV